jgi:EAL domain-containing protein (putative c-di-GMP-specific phosphodiesterase class I)
MSDNSVDSVIDAEFHLCIRQALLGSQHSTRQVALMLVTLDEHSIRSAPLTENECAIHNAVMIRIRNDLRESDTVMALANGRIGVLLVSVTGRDDVDQVIKRLMPILLEPLEVGSGTRNLAPRLGAALFPEHSKDAGDLFHKAEDALIQAKSSHRAYSFYSGESDGFLDSRHWMTELRQAIVSDQLHLLYQPKVNLKSEHVVGAEVLTRWSHPSYGMIVPEKFIPVAERTGLIIPLTLWVLQQALQQCRLWRNMGLDLNVAVNLTMWNLETPELPQQIAGLLRDAGVPANKLELEITESAIMCDPERVIRTLNQVRDLGVQFAIDDFGTGYSSFAHLSRLPVASVKIDKSFMMNIETDRQNSMIVRSIIDLAHNLRLGVVAEGVESRDTRDLLISFDCDEAQGYLFSPPISAEAMTKYILAPARAGLEQGQRKESSQKLLQTVSSRPSLQAKNNGCGQ